MGLVLGTAIVVAVSGAAFVVPAFISARRRLPSVSFVIAFATFHILFLHLSAVPVLSLLSGLFGERMLKYFACYGTILSIYTTVVEMTDFNCNTKRTLCTSGGLLAAVRAFQDVDGYGTWSAPITVAFVILAVSWGKKMWQTKSIYPEKDKWVKLVIPGVASGTLAMLCRFLLESSWNYGISHSVYHLLMAAALSFFIKVCKEGSKNDSSCLSKLGCGKLGCIACLC